MLHGEVDRIVEDGDGTFRRHLQGTGVGDGEKIWQRGERGPGNGEREMGRVKRRGIDQFN